EQFEDPFNQYAIPETILRFRQGFGRLIRRKDDRGVVVIFDRGVISKGYAQLFLNSLPTCTDYRGRLADLPRLAVRGLERQSAACDGCRATTKFIRHGYCLLDG